MNPHAMRRAFASELITGLWVVWPILSGILLAIVVLGLVIGLIECWAVQESIYFAFVSGLTIGYGDLAPKTFTTRLLAIAVAFCGSLLTALMAAVAVKALSNALNADSRE